jgi:hypothetical protein
MTASLNNELEKNNRLASTSEKAGSNGHTCDLILECLVQM